MRAHPSSFRANSYRRRWRCTAVSINTLNQTDQDGQYAFAEHMSYRRQHSSLPMRHVMKIRVRPITFYAENSLLKITRRELHNQTKLFLSSSPA